MPGDDLIARMRRAAVEYGRAQRRVTVAKRALRQALERACLARRELKGLERAVRDDLKRATHDASACWHCGGPLDPAGQCSCLPARAKAGDEDCRPIDPEEV